MAQSAATVHPSTDSSNSSEIDFHKGNALLKLSNTYPSLLLTVVETIQNGIDGMADRIFVGIDLRSRTLNVADNGEGVSIHTFERALSSVGQTIKTAGKLGRFGLGLISPLTKCRSFTFTSSYMADPGRKSTKWTFEAGKMAMQHRGLSIPRETISGLPVIHRAFQPYLVDDFRCDYRTLVNMKAITEDKVVSLLDLDELEGETLAKLGNEMRRKRVKVLVVLIDEKGRVTTREITASDFAGEKLPEVTYEDSAAGTVTIALYKAPRRSGSRKGLVSVMEANNPSSISIQDLARQARMSRWKEETESVIAALTSGFFEGTITASRVSMSPERTKFENNDALHGLYYTLGLWFDEHGKTQFKNEEDVSREERYQELGLKSQKRLQEFFSLPAGERLMMALRSTVKFGRLGDGHVTPESGRPNGPEPITSIRVGQGGAGVKRTPSATPRPPRSGEAGPDRPGDTPLGTTGPRGNTRRLVRGDSQGLWYEHSQLPGNSHLWEFDLELGVLTFNVRHPIWLRLDSTNGKHQPRNARWIMHLQEWLTLQVLNLLVIYPDFQEFEDHRNIIDDQLKLYVEMFIVSPTTR